MTHHAPAPLNQQILVPFDGSENSHEALKFAVGLAKAFHDTIVVLHVIPGFETPHVKLFFDKHSIEEYQQSLFDEAVKPAMHTLQMAGVPFSTKMKIGSPREQILEEAKSRPYRCIVMGSRGFSPFVASVLGSVSQGVVHLATIPVIIVPPKTF